MSFGRYIAESRKAKHMSQKELAARIAKENGETISAQYLNDIEHDRRNPPSEFMLEQIAEELDLEVDYLNYLAGKLPEDIQQMQVDPEKVVELMKAFRREVGSDKDKE